MKYSLAPQCVKPPRSPATLLTESCTAKRVCVLEAPNTECVMLLMVKTSKTADVQLMPMLT